jgi:hypothetical protein
MPEAFGRPPPEGLPRQFYVLICRQGRIPPSFTLIRSNNILPFKVKTIKQRPSGRSATFAQLFRRQKVQLALFIACFGILGVVLMMSTRAAPGDLGAGDVNGDNQVNIFDLSILLTNWHDVGATWSNGDLNGNGTVDIFDLSALLSNWGKSYGTTPPPPPPGPSGKKCFVSLHGKGGDGGPTWQQTWSSTYIVWNISPTGNGDGGGWGPHHWEYASESNYLAARTIITNAINAETCGQVTLSGFSNGAAMAAKLYCRGETFSNKLVGYIVDDPVPDQVVDGCSPTASMPLILVQSDDMNAWIPTNGPCPGGWTCQGTVYSRENYRSRIGASNRFIVPSHSPSGSSYFNWYTPWWK